jgi:diguanylate cyclase (GGDEF)-like protein
MNEPSCNAGGESARIAALHRYEVLDSPPEEAFDRITRLVKTVLKMPMAVVSLVDRDRQWFKSRQGVAAAQTARDISFCTHAIMGTEPLIVPDSLADPRFAESPLVRGEPHIRFYVGVPLRNPDGYNLGALCAMDTNPRTLGPEQVDMLKDLSRLVVDELELRLIASIDALTGLMTRRAFTDAARRDVARALRYHRSLSCLMIDADHFKAVNDTHGHAVGDCVLQGIAAACRLQLRAGDYLGRIGGEEFAAILPETAPEQALEVAERLREVIAAQPSATAAGEIRVTVSIGVATLARPQDLETLLANADAALYAAKGGGRNRTACHRAAERTVSSIEASRSPAI